MVEKGVSCPGLKLSPGLPWYICSPFPRYHAIQAPVEDTSKLSRLAYLTMTRPCLKTANQRSPLACRLVRSLMAIRNAFKQLTPLLRGIERVSDTAW